MVGWAAATLLAFLFLPWTRSSRNPLEYVPASIGLRAWTASPLLALAGLLCLAAIAVAFLPLYSRRAAQAALAVGAAGAAATLLAVYLRGTPAGMGAMATLLGFLGLAAMGLSRAGYIQADTFVVTSLLWVALFVAIFILYPLWAVLKAAFVVGGRLTAEAFVATVRSPAFLLVENPNTPRPELLITLVVGLAGAGVIAVARLLLGRGAAREEAEAGEAAPAGLARTLGWALAGGAACAAVAALWLGFGALRNSLLLALAVGTVATALGFAFALVDDRSVLRTRRLLGPLSILPMITPPFVLGLAVIYMFGRRGFVTHQVLGLSTNIFFGPLGVAVTQVLAFTPIAYLVLVGVVRALDAALEEAAETLGASRWHILRTVIWPLVRPGIANAWLLVVIESLADFGNPLILGGGVPFLATEVFYAIVGRFNPHEASSYGVVLLVMTLTAFLIQRFWVGRRSYVTVTGRPSARRSRPLPPAVDYAVTGVFLAWAVLILGLYFSIFSGSLVKLWGFDYTVTVQHVKDLSPTGWAVFRTTARLAAVAAVPSALLGLLIGYLVTRHRVPGITFLEIGSMLSFATPGTVMGVGYVLAFNQGPLLLTGTEIIILTAFVFRNMPVGIRAGVAAITQIDRALEEASTMLRASSLTTLRRIVFPLVRPAALSGLVFSFVRAMTAVSQVIFLVTA
ncbi:MAG: iron ABC transporter permease, partial [Armatimonadetes bacterium]|nr:iron ABC transporter permease [Armatimonadota bacterium]